MPHLPLPAAGKTRICVAGFWVSHNTGKARAVAKALQEAQPDLYETWFCFTGFREWYDYLAEEKRSYFQFGEGHSLANHTSSPFTWLETSNGIQPLGGRDSLCDWVVENAEARKIPEDIVRMAKEEPSRLSDTVFDYNEPGSCQQRMQ